MSSLLADLTPLTLNEPLQDGDLCWCHSAPYRISYHHAYRLDWCYSLGCHKTQGPPAKLKTRPKIYFGIVLPEWLRHRKLG